MSNQHKFPTEEQVRHAYIDVLLTCYTMEHCTEPQPLENDTIQNLEALFGQPSEEGQGLLSELNEEDAEKEENEIIAGFDFRHGKLFPRIGLQLEVVDVTVLNNNRIDSYNRIVPELEDPEKFVAYMGKVGVKGVYEDPIHTHLAKDVIDRIRDIVTIYDNEIAEYKPVDRPGYDYTPQMMRGVRDDALRNFRALMPFYFNADFSFMDAYVILEKRLMARRIGSL